MILILKDFISYLKQPVFLRKPNGEISLKIIGVLFLLCVLLSWPLGLIDQIKWVKLYFGILQDRELNDILTHGFVYGIITAVIIAPILEEYIFRYYLSEFYANVVFVFINIYIIVYNLFLLHNSNAFIVAGALLIIGLIFFSIINNNKKIRIKAIRLMHTHFRFIFYLSAIAFGALHINNYNFEKHIIILPIVLVLSQLIAGLFLGYIRLNYGIRFSILFHALNNLFFLIILFTL